MKSLKPSEVRARVLRDHDELRARLGELATAVQHADEPRSPWREGIAALSRRLKEHVALEDDILAPVLSRTDFWGPDRLARLRGDYERHRVELEGLVSRWEALPGARRGRAAAAELAREVRRIAFDLDADMDAEERSLLHPSLLADDIVSVDQSDG